MLELNHIHCGDCLPWLRGLPDACVQCCVTSPPYWGLRDYGVAGQLGLEATPEEYIARMVEIFREVRRVLRSDGTLWLNMGDSYARSSAKGEKFRDTAKRRWSGQNANGLCGPDVPLGLKPKDLCMIPARLAIALQADGWWLRSDIIWAKPNPMPASVTDRPTTAHEHIFLLTKAARYFYDAEAIKEPNQVSPTWNEPPSRCITIRGEKRNGLNPVKGESGWRHLKKPGEGRNKRTVWTVATAGFSEAHFATFPPKLITPCILAGTSEKGACPECGKPWERIVKKGFTGHDGKTESRYSAGTTANRLALLRQAARERGSEYANESTTIAWRPGCECDAGEPVPCVVMDPFMGAGTTALVAWKLGRHYCGCELNPEYVALAAKRLKAVSLPLLEGTP